MKPANQELLNYGDFKIITENDNNLLNIDDLPFIINFNEKQNKKIAKLPITKKQKEINAKILTELLPEPFIGNPKTARILLLALNPGFKGGEKGEHYWHSQEKFRKLIFDNLSLGETAYPYYYMNEEKDFNETPGHIWCKRIFKELIAATGHSYLSKQICCIQFHGYHSNAYKYLGNKLPSQNQTFELIKLLLKKDIPVVIMRSKKIWFDAIEELKDYKKLIILKNPRNHTISKGNMQENDFKELLNALS